MLRSNELRWSSVFRPYCYFALLSFSTSRRSFSVSISAVTQVPRTERSRKARSVAFAEIGPGCKQSCGRRPSSGERIAAKHAEIGFSWPVFFQPRRLDSHSSHALLVPDVRRGPDMRRSDSKVSKEHRCFTEATQHAFCDVIGLFGVFCHSVKDWK